MPLLLQSIRTRGKRYVWHVVVASGLVLKGMGSAESDGSVWSPCVMLLGSNSLQSNSGSTCFSFLPLILMGSAHLERDPPRVWLAVVI